MLAAATSLCCCSADDARTDSRLIDDLVVRAGLALTDEQSACLEDVVQLVGGQVLGEVGDVLRCIAPHSAAARGES